MVNGNTILEFEEANYQRLMEIFIKENKDKFDEFLNIKLLETEEEFKEIHIDKFNEIIMDEFNSMEVIQNEI